MKKLFFKTPFTAIALSIFMILSLNGCTFSDLLPESEFPKAITGEWLGTVGDLKESIKFEDNGNFTAKIRPAGFLYNTIPDGRTGTISGTWLIRDNTITLKITGTKNEHVANSEAISTILEFRKNEIRLKDEKGEISTFIREVSL